MFVLGCWEGFLGYMVFKMNFYILVGIVLSNVIRLENRRVFIIF